MNTFQFKCFLTLAKFLNFTKTADMLNITQPALSKIISGFEEEMQVTLFYRDRRTVKLTAAGEVFLKDIDKVIMSLNRATENARAMKNGLRGVINIGF